jgi:hypothetical protein
MRSKPKLVVDHAQAATPMAQAYKAKLYLLHLKKTIPIYFLT